MGGMRKDYLSDRYAIVAARERRVADPRKSPLAPGGERRTGPSVLSLVDRDGMLQRMQDGEGEYVRDWLVRVFESPTPAVSTSAENEYRDRPHYVEPAYGHHYVVAATPDPSATFSTIGVDQWSRNLLAIQDRLRWLYTQKGVTYVAVHASHGEAAGALDAYPHLDVLTFSAIPPVIEAEAAHFRRSLDERGACPMCQVLALEDGGPRQVLQTEGFVALCPWAPSSPYEFWICPKKHTTSFSKITQKEINDLSLILRATLGGLSRAAGDPAYSLAFHLSPEKKNSKQIHWHIEVYPATGAWSGLERGYGVFLHGTSPEEAAKGLGAACRRELAGLVGVV